MKLFVAKQLKNGGSDSGFTYKEAGSNPVRRYISFNVSSSVQASSQNK